MALLVQNPSLLQPPSSSAAGILAYLVESDISLKAQALTKLYSVIDIHWAEICDYLPQIEELSEDSSFPAAELASYLASKCFYHLQEYADALRLALSAGKYLDVTVKSEYIDTLLAKCIDEYKILRVQQLTDLTIIIDPRMENIIEQMFCRCYNDSCFEQAIGVALDTHRIDKLQQACTIAISTGKESILGYTFNLCQGTRNITSREFRLAVIEVLVNLYATLPHPDFSNVCIGYQHLNRPAEVAKVLDNLCRADIESALQAYQIAFDLQESENQGFVLKTVAALQLMQTPATATEMETGAETRVGPSDESMDVTEAGEDYADRMNKLKRILLEGFDVDLTLNFLYKQSHADIEVLKSIKTATEGGRAASAILHNATVVSHAFMNCGTTMDTFLRENLDWLGKANNWAKFTAVASIGVVHKGHVHESMNLLQPYLPQAGQSASPFSESGALCALGLIHANKGGAGDSLTISYLSEALRNAGVNDTVQHGACLGIGLAAMATGDAELFESLRQVLFTDSAVAGEGAALAIGLLLLGQCDSPLAEQEMPNLLNAAHDNTHEKVVRALALSIAMMVYGKEESADVVIEQLSRDRDPIIRYGAMYAIGMAYCGTNDNSAIRKLLHVAVSDVNDDVRRAAVTCLGFVCFSNPEIVPKLVALLAESFNPHMRYGACMAVGIACAGQPSKDAIDLLTSMQEDPIDFVRQGVLMAMAMVLQQTSEARSPSVKKFREHLTKVIGDKHQSPMAKVGAILAAGILDAGGRNVAISLHSRAGFVKMGAAVGVMMFLQYWYWYPLMNFLSLSFSPTMLIGLNKDFDMPTNFSVLCNAPPSMFAYPKAEEKKGDEKKLVATAVLSTTAKAKAREARKEARKTGTAASVPEAPGLERVHSHVSTASYISIEEKAEEVKPKKEKEASYFVVSNPSRVTPSQARFISLVPTAGIPGVVNTRLAAAGGASPAKGPSSPSHSHAPIPIPLSSSKSTSHSVSAPTVTFTAPVPAPRYRPVSIGRRASPFGIVMLIDQDPTQPEQVQRVNRVALGEGVEADAPEPFEWDPNDE